MSDALAPAVAEAAVPGALDAGALEAAGPVPGVTLDPGAGLVPPGSIAGEPDVVECVPVAVGRSVAGAPDCAKAGIAAAVATRQAAICFFSIVISPGMRGSRARQVKRRLGWFVPGAGLPTL
ncbi:MAG TPA: hypothetical protein VHN20_01490 [Beijerinckiaceae bacterium]|nr:hypothetical protein [Beijerinckiaceae bacterium]